jgi:hypothetical protein
MEPSEFLGRYENPETVAIGPIQTSRATDSETGRPVFLHRVSASEHPAEHADLLKLVASALVRSSEVKRLLLDFCDEQGFCYVVTEAQPQCASLPEWLRLKSNGMPPPSRRAAAAPPAAAMGEFARLFAGSTSAPIPEPAPPPVSYPELLSYGQGVSGPAPELLPEPEPQPIAAAPVAPAPPPLPPPEPEMIPRPAAIVEVEATPLIKPPDEPDPVYVRAAKKRAGNRKLVILSSILAALTLLLILVVLLMNR